jgi:hypothetical protein
MIMWRGITASIVAGSLLSLSALAQAPAAGAPAPPAVEPGAAGGRAGGPPPLTAQQEEARAKAEQREAEARINAEIRAVDARRAAEVRSQQDAAANAAAERDRARASLDRLKLEQSLLSGRLRNARPRPVRKETIAYCGVSVSEPAGALTDQLKLQPGTGLVVDFVVEKSAAESAGVRQYDVITRLDDQVLTNSEQFRALIRMKKPGEGVKLWVIRRGEPTVVSVALGQQEVEEEIGQVNDAGLNKLGQALVFDNGGNLAITNPQALDFNVMGGGIAVTNVNGKNQAIWTDEKHVLTMELGKDGKATRLTAKDPAGKQLFDGPVATDEERKALPADIADTLKKAEAGGPVRLQLNMRLPPPTPAAPPGMVGGDFITGIAPGGGRAMGGARRVAPDGKPRPRVLTSTEKDTLMLVRIDETNKATWVFAFSELDGKTLFDGPIATDEQRKAMPEPIARQLDSLEKNQAAAGEFGVMGR